MTSGLSHWSSNPKRSFRIGNSLNCELRKAQKTESSDEFEICTWLLYGTWLCVVGMQVCFDLFSNFGAFRHRYSSKDHYLMILMFWSSYKVFSHRTLHALLVNKHTIPINISIHLNNMIQSVDKGPLFHPSVLVFQILPQDSEQKPWFFEVFIRDTTTLGYFFEHSSSILGDPYETNQFIRRVIRCSVSFVASSPWPAWSTSWTSRGGDRAVFDVTIPKPMGVALEYLPDKKGAPKSKKFNWKIFEGSQGHCDSDNSWKSVDVW